MEIEVVAKKWGSSLGFILPKSIVDTFNINENDRIFIDLKKKHLAKEFFGMLPAAFKKSTQELKDEMKKGW